MSSDANSNTAMAPMGSTAPLNEPIRNDRHLLLPAARIGIEMMAPSGTFWMAIPNDTATALASEILVVPLSAPANTTPTAIPSGRLWMVTAKASMAVFDRWERIPSGLSVPMCKCGVSSSISSRNPIPNRNPTAAGITLHLPLSAPISIAGISSDHTDAATITPEANPNKDFCSLSDISPFIKNTKAEPSMVPSSGISNPMIIVVVITLANINKKSQSSAIMLWDLTFVEMIRSANWVITQ